MDEQKNTELRRMIDDAMNDSIGKDHITVADLRRLNTIVDYATNFFYEVEPATISMACKAAMAARKGKSLAPEMTTIDHLVAVAYEMQIEVGVSELNRTLSSLN